MRKRFRRENARLFSLGWTKGTSLPLFISIPACDRAHKLAGSVFALHARNRLAQHTWIVRVPFKIAVEPNPMHLAPASYLFLADDGNIVLRLASQDEVVGKEDDR